MRRHLQAAWRATKSELWTFTVVSVTAGGLGYNAWVYVNHYGEWESFSELVHWFAFTWPGLLLPVAFVVLALTDFVQWAHRRPFVFGWMVFWLGHCLWPIHR